MTEASSGESVLAEFWFDPICPWAWIASRWMLEVEKVRPVKTHWHIMSLSYLNIVQHQGEGLSEQYMQRMRAAWGPVRVCAAAAAAHGDEILLPLYSAIGTRVHNQGRRDELEKVIVEALDELDLDPALAGAADSEAYDESIIASHTQGMNLVGLEVGTPTLAVHLPGKPGPIAFFGPVVTPIPRGEAAAALWDGVLLVAGTNGFFELKRSRDRHPSFD